MKLVFITPADRLILMRVIPVELIDAGAKSGNVQCIYSEGSVTVYPLVDELEYVEYPSEGVGNPPHQVSAFSNFHWLPPLSPPTSALYGDLCRIGVVSSGLYFPLLLPGPGTFRLRRHTSNRTVAPCSTQCSDRRK